MEWLLFVICLGEGQVYTTGMIGKHKVVCTKLSRIGHGEGAVIAAGGTVTRMLGKLANHYPIHTVEIACTAKRCLVH